MLSLIDGLLLKNSLAEEVDANAFPAGRIGYDDAGPAAIEAAFPAGISADPVVMSETIHFGEYGSQRFSVDYLWREGKGLPQWLQLPPGGLPARLQRLLAGHQPSVRSWAAHLPLHNSSMLTSPGSVLAGAGAGPGGVAVRFRLPCQRWHRQPVVVRLLLVGGAAGVLVRSRAVHLHPQPFQQPHAEPPEVAGPERSERSPARRHSRQERTLTLSPSSVAGWSWRQLAAGDAVATGPGFRNGSQLLAKAAAKALGSPCGTPPTRPTSHACESANLQPQSTRQPTKRPDSEMCSGRFRG